MANTIIQIKRSTSSATPANGSLSAAELAYSYNSNRLFIGNTTGTGVVEIGGKYWLDLLVRAYDTANTGGGGANSAYDVANSAFGKANATNVFAFNISSGANGYSTTVGLSGNTYANLVGAAANAWSNSINTYSNSTYVRKAGDTITGDLIITGNITVSGATTYANTQTLLIGDSILTLNADLPGAVAPSENAGIEVNRGSAQANAALFWNESTDKWQFTSNISSSASYFDIASTLQVSDVATSANGFATTVGTAGNTYATLVGTSGNAYSTLVGTSGNAFATLVGTSGNAYTDSVNTRIFQTFSNAANIISGTIASARLSGSYTGITGVGTIGTGVWNGSVISVPYGGTGVTSFSNNGVIFGSGFNNLRVTDAGTEGQVLQASTQGTPLFGMLDGGSF